MEIRLKYFESSSNGKTSVFEVELLSSNFSGSIIGDWCNGNTGVSKTLARGSIPRSPARKFIDLSQLFII